MINKERLITGQGSYYYTWEDNEQYRDYMLNTLAFMEPRSEQQGNLVYD